MAGDIGLFGHHAGPPADEWRARHRARAEAAERQAAALPPGDPRRAYFESEALDARRRARARFGGPHSREQRDQSLRNAKIERTRDDGS